jgi:hypothetical protein
MAAAGTFAMTLGVPLAAGAALVKRPIRQATPHCT